MAAVALVTGASSGIGLATSIQLARAGFTTVATMRDLGRAGALKQRADEEGVELDIHPVDVVDRASIDAAVASVILRHKRIDLLVNNAGAGHLGTLEQTSTADARRVMDVNFFGVWEMIAAVLPHMRKAGSGRIINLSSVGGIAGQPFNDAYCAAKFAVEGMSESLAAVVRQLGIFVSIIEPGAVNTNFVATVAGGAGDLLSETDDPYRPLLDRYLTATQQHFDAGQVGDDIAAVIVKAATDDPPHLRYQTSATSRQVATTKFADPDGDSVLELTGARLRPT
jgi:NAD(P)-dependent dehydrogenase (short-subunit alcohol dehydrogenase family)